MDRVLGLFGAEPVVLMETRWLAVSLVRLCVESASLGGLAGLAMVQVDGDWVGFINYSLIYLFPIGFTLLYVGDHYLIYAFR